MEEGRFLVREKPGGVETYAVSMVVNGMPAHHLIERLGTAFCVCSRLNGIVPVTVLQVNGQPFDHTLNLGDLIQKMRAQR